jgi:hypothetical protein
MSPTPAEADRTGGRGPSGPAPRCQERGATDSRGNGNGEGNDGAGEAPAEWHRFALARMAAMWGEALRRFRSFVERKGN